MPRTLGVEFPGAISHVLRRGDRREAIFRDAVDRQDFHKTMGYTYDQIGQLKQAEGRLADGLTLWGGKQFGYAYDP